MLTGVVLANVAVGGLAVLTAPLPFRGLLELHYPPGFRGEASGALAEDFAPEPHCPVRGHARVIPFPAHPARE
jgi:hypothetical protein